MDSLYVKLLREGRRNGSGGLSTRTVRYIHAIVSKALGDAHRKGIVSRNVATMADPPKTNGSKRKKSIQVWSTRDLRRFLRLTCDSAYHDLYLVASNTGMRRGELLGLRWEDVDLDAATISIHRTVVTVHYEIHVSDVKTDTARRTIDLNNQTIAVLRQRRRREGDDAGDDRDLVFGRTGQEPYHPERISKTFDRLVGRHGLPAIRFHDLRLLTPLCS